MHTQQTQHEQLTKQMEDFITTQRQQVEDVTNYQVQDKGRFSALKSGGGDTEPLFSLGGCGIKIFVHMLLCTYNTTTILKFLCQAMPTFVTGKGHLLGST